MVRLSYDLTDNSQMYVSYTEGSKAGGFDIRGNSIPGTPLLQTTEDGSLKKKMRLILNGAIR